MPGTSSRPGSGRAGIRYNESYRTVRFGGLVNNYALRNRLLDTDPATAFNPFGIGQNTRQVKNEVIVTTHEFEDSALLTEDFTLRGDMFNLPGGAVRFADRCRALGRYLL